jgi:hypothetical protein
MQTKSDLSGMKSSNLSPSQLLIVVLAVLTALVHFYLCLASGFDIIFFLNFLGYLGLTVVYFLPIPFFQNYHRLVRWAFMAFVAVTIIAWIVVGMRVWYGYVDKLIEVGLLVLLWIDK